MFRFRVHHLFSVMAMVAITAGCVKFYWPDPLVSALACAVPWLIFNAAALALASDERRRAFHVGILLFTCGTIAANLHIGLPKIWL